jgi:hypothetical protein
MDMQISEDGQYKWDGSEWIPINSSEPQKQAPVAVETPGPSGGAYPWMESGEVVTDEFSGILEYTTSNPILRIINSIAMLFMSILGFKQKVNLIVTNRRVIMDIRNYSLYIFESGTDMVNVIRADAITTGFNSTLLIFKKRYISIDNMVIGTDRKFSQTTLENAALNIGKVLK